MTSSGPSQFRLAALARGAQELAALVQATQDQQAEILTQLQQIGDTAQGVEQESINDRAALHTQFDALSASVDALTARVTALENTINPPPPQG